MRSVRFRHIVVGLAVTFILFLFYRMGEEDFSNCKIEAHPLGPIPTQSPNLSIEIDQTFPDCSNGSLNPSNLTRHDILQTRLKGFREATFWGEVPPTFEMVKQMSNDEFDHFIEEVEIDDANVYWGASY